MAWTDQIIDAQYTSPGGIVFTFQYGVLSRESDLKTATFTFPEKDGAFVQSLGRGGRRFPISCIFSGANCFAEADKFETALEERGYGELQHPIYGRHKVVPTGTIKRTDNPVTDGNQSIVEVSFSETIIDEKFPTNETETADSINEKIEAFSEAAAAEFDSDLLIANTTEMLNTKAVLTEQVRTINDSLAPLAKKDTSVWTDFQSTMTALEKNITNFIDHKIDIAQQAYNAMRTPSKISIKILAKIEGYATIINSLVKTYKKDPYGKNDVKNQYIATRMQLQNAMCCVAFGAADCAGKTGADGFSSREEAIETATMLAELFDSIQEYSDSKVAKDLFVETGDAYDAMVNVVQKSIAIIIDSSFSLRTRKIKKLDRDRQLLELLAELYGGIDEYIDEFVIDNKLTIDEIQLLPMGRKVAYYA